MLKRINITSEQNNIMPDKGHLKQTAQFCTACRICQFRCHVFEAVTFGESLLSGNHYFRKFKVFEFTSKISKRNRESSPRSATANQWVLSLYKYIYIYENSLVLISRIWTYNLWNWSSVQCSTDWDTRLERVVRTILDDVSVISFSLNSVVYNLYI